jgi:crotonobetainyl-CoA:carnitine CoA-transferase CaiB-like acyl-CoA transferase
MTETTSQQRGRGLLEGVRVLDFGRVLAGPHCTLLLASLGAEVIKIERPGVGDDARANRYRYPNGISAYFMQQNWGKKSISLDLKRPEAIQIVKELVQRSDVLVENFRPGTMEGLGLGWDVLRQINPRLIMCSISAFGQTGPDARRPGYGALAEARAGIPEMTGEPDGPPMPSIVPVADSMAASHAFGAICAALFHRERTGRGEYIDVSLLDCAFETQDWPIQQYLASDGQVRMTRRGLFDRVLVPWGYFKARGGYVCMIVSNDGFWRRLAELMGRPELADDERFATVEARARNGDEVYRIVGEWVARYPDLDELVHVLQDAGIPADRVQTIEQAVHDRQLHARQMIVERQHPLLGTVRVVNTALRFGGSVSGLPKDHAPLLGEHNEYVLREVLGYSEEQVRTLYDQRVLYAEPLVRQLPGRA